MEGSMDALYMPMALSMLDSIGVLNGSRLMKWFETTVSQSLEIDRFEAGTLDFQEPIYIDIVDQHGS